MMCVSKCFFYDQKQSFNIHLERYVFHAFKLAKNYIFNGLVDTKKTCDTYSTNNVYKHCGCCFFGLIYEILPSTFSYQYYQHDELLKLKIPLYIECNVYLNARGFRIV